MSYDSFEHNTALYLPARGYRFCSQLCFLFLFSAFDIVSQGQDIQLVSIDSAEPASLWMESNMEDNSGLDLICARNSLSNGLLSETNPTIMSNLERLKVKQIMRNYLNIPQVHVWWVFKSLFASRPEERKSVWKKGSLRQIHQLFFAHTRWIYTRNLIEWPS